MPSYKALQGIAHDIGHSFTSLMNFVDDDHVMGHILKFARNTGRDTLIIDFVNQEAHPPELLAAPISGVPAEYTRMFWYLVQQCGSDKSLVQSAILTLRYDLAIKRPHQEGSRLISSPFTCDVRIIDIRGKAYSAHFEDWWYPESL
jgi:hypothetical protein